MIDIVAQNIRAHHKDNNNHNNNKNNVQGLKHPSADAVPQNVYKSDTAASNTLCQ